MARIDITDKLIRVEITDEMIRRANEHALIDKAVYGFHNSKSFTDDKSRVLGSLGEEVVSKYFKTPRTNTKDYDIILNGEAVEIKSRSINVNQIWNDYDVAALKPSDGCDKYVFVIVHNSFRYAWIVGEMERIKFNDNCRRVRFKDSIVYKMYISDLQMYLRMYPV